MTEKESAEADDKAPGGQAGSAAAAGDEQRPNRGGAAAGDPRAGEPHADDSGVAAEADASAAADVAPEDERLALQQRAEAAEARAQEYWDRIVRMEAEKDNIRKRAEKDAASARKQALEKFAGEILAVRDSLELGQDAAHRDDADIDKIREGTDLTLKMLTQALEKFDIEEVNPVGEKFDPELHQAMSTQEASEGQPANTVTQVVQKGYRMGDRLLRPALVIVAK